MDSLTFDELMCTKGMSNDVKMTLLRYADGGWLDTWAGETSDFVFPDGGKIVIEDDSENDEFGKKAIFVDESANKENFNLMF